MTRTTLHGVLALLPAAAGAIATPGESDQGRCLRLIGEHRFDAARALATDLVERDPSSSRAHLLLALTYHKQKRYASAEPLFAHAASLDPKDPAARVFHGWCLYNLGRAREAREAFEAAVAIDARSADAHFALGLLDYDADDLTSAERQFTASIALAARKGAKAGEAKARTRLADVHTRRGRLEEAKRELERAVQLNPDLYGAYFKLSRVLQRLGDSDGAAEARRMHNRVRERVQPAKGHPE